MAEDNKTNEEDTPIVDNPTPRVYTEEEVAELKREMQSNSEAGVQKVISEKKAYETAMDNLSKVADDPNYLITLYEENPSAARIILAKHYDGQDIEAFKESIEYKPNYEDPKVIENLVKQQALKLSETEKIERETTDFIKALKLDGEELEKFNEALAERMELKSFKVSDIERHLERAYREVSDNTDQLKELQKTKELAKTLATGSGGSSSTKGMETNKTQDEAKDFVNTYIN